MNEVVWTAAALGHLRAIRSYIEQFNPKAASELAAQLIAAGNSLRNFPHRGRPVRGTTMRELASVSPYIIRYRIEAKGRYPPRSP